MKRTTIYDVAAKARVSLATVDRVINRRPGVKAATIAKVEEAIKSINYRRNIFAANLATGKEYNFKFILYGGDNSFMVQLHREAQMAAERFSSERIFISIVDADTFDDKTTAYVLEKIDPRECSGVAVFAGDAPMVREALDVLAERGIPIVTLVSDVPMARRRRYVGIDNTAAGRVAGTLMGRFVGARQGTILTLAGSLVLRDHAERRFGFEQVLSRDFPNLRLLPVEEGRDDGALTENIAETALRNHKDILGIYNIGAGNRGLIKALERTGLGGKVVVIAHELTPYSRRALLEGAFDALIAQDPAEEVRCAVETLKSLNDDDRPVGVSPPNFSPLKMSIFFRDNLP